MEVQKTTVRLSLPEGQLAEARQQYVADLKAKQEREAAFAIIIPELERLWKEKLPQHAELVPPFEHYLAHYTPQLLRHAIHRLSEIDSEITYIRAYFKDVVHNIRLKQIEKEQRATVTADC